MSVFITVTMAPALRVLKKNLKKSTLKMANNACQQKSHQRVPKFRCLYSLFDVIFGPNCGYEFTDRPIQQIEPKFKIL